MSRRAKIKALTTALMIAAAFILIVWCVVTYEQQLTKINWALVGLLSAFVFGGVAIYRWNATEDRYSIMDLFMNSKTNKPDPYRHLMFLFAGLTVWAIIQVVLNKEWEHLNALLLGALGFFVAKPAVDGLSDALSKRSAGGDVEVTGEVTVKGAKK